MATQGSRYAFIDAVRGIAASLVMLQHALYRSGLLGPINSHLTGFNPNQLELGETGVVAFFLVSGFIIPLSLEKTKSFKLFWLHRALRIYPLYLAIYIVTLTIVLGGSIDSVWKFLGNLSAHLFFIQEYVKQQNFVEGSWTLSLEMIWYISISTLFLLGLNKKTGLIVAAAVLASLAAEIFCANGLRLPMGRLSMLVCCVFGFVCYRYERNELSDKHFAIAFVILTAAIFANLLVGMALFPSDHPTSTFVMARQSWFLAGVIFFAAYFTRNSPLWRDPRISFIGRISYSIYLVHPIVLYVFSFTAVTGLVLIVLVFGITIALSALAYQFIEAPPIRFGHALRARQGRVMAETRSP